MEKILILKLFFVYSKSNKNNETEKPLIPKLTVKQKIRSAWKNITVEPLLAAYIVPSVLSVMAMQNLNLEKACRVNLAYPEDVCDALTRRETTNYTMYISY